MAGGESGGQGQDEGLYASPAEAAKEVRTDYLYWTGKLTDSSFELSVALIAANWAVFGERLVQNVWAKLSIFLVLLGLAISLLGAKRMSELHRVRMDYSEEAPERWRREYEAAHGQRVSWPFTDEIERLGFVLRLTKTWLPLAGGLLLLIGVLYP